MPEGRPPPPNPAAHPTQSPQDGTELLLTPLAGFLPLMAKPRSGTGWP